MTTLMFAPSARASLASTGISFSGGPVAIDAQRSLIFTVSGYSNHALDTLDATTHEVVRSVPVDVAAANFALDTAEQRLYLADFNGSRVLQYSEASELLATIPLGGQQPIAVALDAGLSRLAVLTLSNSILFYDTTTLAPVGTVTLPPNSDPTALAVNSVTHRAYVTSMPAVYARPGFMSVIDEITGSIIDTINAWPNGYPQGVAIDATRGRVYVSAYGAEVTVIDSGSDAVLGAFGAGNTGPIAVNERLNRVYVSDYGNAYISVFDPASSTLGPRISISAGGAGLAVNSSTNLIYASNGLTVAVLHGIPRAEFFSTPPAISNTPNAKFTFGAVDRDSTSLASDVGVACSLDGAGPTSCVSPLRLHHLADGTHQLRIQATGAQVDATPTEYTWTVDTIAPVSTFDTTSQSVLLSGSAVQGHTTDMGTGVADVRITYTDSFGHATTTSVATQCGDSAPRICYWSAPPPAAPGSYRVNAIGTDPAGNTETAGPTIYILNA